MSHDNEFTPPNNDEIIELIRLVNESDFDEFKLEMGGLKLFFSKNATTSPDRIFEPSGTMEPQPVKPEQTMPENSAEAVTPETGEPSKIASQKFDTKEPDIIDEEGLIPIKSPLLGIFYRSPKPGSPPFVEEGSQINEEDTVCLVEVMKLFNTVKAGLKGRIVKICAENNDMVEHNQTLFLVDPEEGVEESQTQ